MSHIQKPPALSDEGNPLLAPQREKSGSTTFSKYLYQYHWALCRLLKEHAAGADYALFVELHEDVTLSSSTNPDEAAFELNQVKNIESRTSVNENFLLRTTESSGSILGKLISGAKNKPFSEKISRLNLVVSCGLKLDLAEKHLDFEVVSVGDLSEASINKLKSSLKEEIGDESIPANLNFVISDLPPRNFDNTTIGVIARLVSGLHPTATFNPVYIYRGLLDELQIRGKVSYDFKEWPDLIKRKAITSDMVSMAINEHTCRKNDDDFQKEAEDAIADLGLQFLERRQLFHAIERYRTQRLGSPSSSQQRSIEAVQNAITTAIGSMPESTHDLIEHAINLLSNEDRALIGEITEVKAAVICELIGIHK